MSVGTVAVQRSGSTIRVRNGLHGVGHSPVPGEVHGGFDVLGDHVIEGRLVEEDIDRGLDVIDPLFENLGVRADPGCEGQNLVGLGSLEDQPDISEADLRGVLGEGIASAGARGAAHDADLAEGGEQFRDERALEAPCVSDVGSGNSAGPWTLPDLCEEAHRGDSGFSLFAIHAHVIADSKTRIQKTSISFRGWTSEPRRHHVVRSASL